MSLNNEVSGRKLGGPVILAAAAWLAVLAVGVLVSTEHWLYPEVYDRVMRDGESAISPRLWLAIDFISPFWLFSNQLALLAVAAAAWTTWRLLRRRDRLTSTVIRAMLIGGVAAATLAAMVIAVLMVPSAFIFVTRPALCKTTTFSEAMSPNGRYKAVVAEVDCGAMSSFHRQVFVTRYPFSWAPSSLMYFRQHPELRLSWSGRTLTIAGNRPLRTMERPPPDPMLWAGVLARYQGPEE
jgi:hypothetical protein